MRIKNKGTNQNPKQSQSALLQSYTEYMIFDLKKPHAKSIWTSLLFLGYSERSAVGVNQVNISK